MTKKDFHNMSLILEGVVKKVGHETHIYGKKAPDLGWRFTDAWLVMAGAGDIGIPNGKPVDEWGIRVEGCRPVGFSVSRGGAANGPAAKYALRKYVEWHRKCAPPGALGMDFYQSLPSQSSRTKSPRERRWIMTS